MFLLNEFGKRQAVWMICLALLSACAPARALANTPTPVVASPMISTPAVTPESERVSTSAPEGCQVIHTITICLQKITHTETNTQVTLKILVENNMVTGSGNSFIFPNDERGLVPTLLDEQGVSYPLQENTDNYWATFDQTEGAYLQTLYFQPVPEDKKKLTVSLPMVAVDTPAQAQPFQIDLGSDPHPGQISNMDVSTVVDGQTFHFVKAEFEGDGINSLRVTLHADPLALPSDIYSMTPLFGDAEKGVFFGAKQGLNSLPLRIFTDLIIPPGKSSGQTENTRISGILNLEVSRITYWYRGPFEIVIQPP